MQSMLMNIINFILLNAKAKETQLKHEPYWKKQSEKLEV